MVVMVLARAMNSSITWVCTSGHTRSLRNPRVCHELVRSLTRRRLACKGGALGKRSGRHSPARQAAHGFAAIVADIQRHGDALGQVEAKPAQALLDGFQQRRVMPIGGRDHYANGDTVTLSHLWPELHRLGWFVFQSGVFRWDSGGGVVVSGY